MIPEEVKTSIGEALALLPASMDNMQARVMMYAIGLQESRMVFRAQVLQGGGKGPARGLWQFERGGGVAGVMRHPSTEKHAERICELRDVEFGTPSVWAKLETDDVLAAAFARLLLWTDASALPQVNDAEAAWQCYVRTWRPGKPHRHTWNDFHAEAVKTSDRRSTTRA